MVSEKERRALDVLLGSPYGQHQTRRQPRHRGVFEIVRPPISSVANPYYFTGRELTLGGNYHYRARYKNESVVQNKKEFTEEVLLNLESFRVTEKKFDFSRKI